MATQYKIKQGDTLGGIAKANNTSIANLQSLNPTITNPNLIQAGASLNLGPITNSPNLPINTTINASNLGATPITVPTPKPPVIGASATITPPLGTISDEMGNASVPPPVEPTAETPKEKSTGDYIKEQFMSLGGLLSKKSEVTQDLQKEQKLALKTETATKDYNTYNKAKLDLNQQIEQIYNTPGMTRQQAQQQASEVTRAGNANLANLAVVAQASQGLLEAANQTIKDKLEAQFAPIQEQIDYYKDFAAINANDLTESEQFKLQELADQKKSELKAVQDTASFLHEAILQNNAPAAIYAAMDKVNNDFITGKINAQEAQTQMFQAVGKYGVDAVKKAQEASANRANQGGVNPGGGAQYANDLDAIVGTVLSTIPSKFGQATFNAQIAKARNDTDKLNIVAAQVLKGQPAEFKNDFRNQAVGIAQIDKAIAELDSGVQTGVLQNATQYAYNIVGKDFDPKLAKINGYITSAIQPYRNSVTGAAWGEQEDGEYASLFGSTKYSPTELRQRLVQTKELLKSKSSEGLNSFVNPLGTYDNAFNVGSLAPDTTDSNPEASVFDDVVSKPSGYWSRLWNSILGK